MKNFIFILSLIALPTWAKADVSIEFLLGSADQESTFDSSFTFNSTEFNLENIALISDKDTSLGLQAGYHFNQNIGIELSYYDFGKANENFIDDFGDTINDSLESTAVNLGLIIGLPLSETFSIAGGIGIAFWDHKLENTDSAFPDEVFTLNEDGNTPYFKIGAEYQLNQRLFFGIEYMLMETEIDITFNDIDFPGTTNIDNEIKNLAFSIGTTF